MSARKQKPLMNFKTMAQIDVPQGRNGKHKQIVTRILADLDQLGKQGESPLGVEPRYSQRPPECCYCKRRGFLIRVE